MIMSNYSVNKNGMLASVGQAGKIIKNDFLRIKTDKGSYDLSKMSVSFDGDKFIYTSNGIQFTLCYFDVPNTGFAARALTMRFPQKTVLYEISASLYDFEGCFLYESFYNASSAVFCREGELGFCAGFENPYFSLKDGELFFEPSLIIEAGEIFECDLNFFGSYKLEGELVRQELPKTEICVNGRYQPRYRNPNEGVGLYYSEINEFGKYVEHYFDVKDKRFRFTSYNFFSNLPQRPKDGEEKQAYFEHIDNFVKIGGDTIILNPLCEYGLPHVNGRDYYELFPKGSVAEQIYLYAKNAGLDVGIYMGTAGTGKYNDSFMNDYGLDFARKVGYDGKLSSENCIADDSFVDWYVDVQCNTVERYGLCLWNWDPGPGNGMFCYNELHGHLAGKGEYKGFRNSLKVMKKMRQRLPNLYFMAFHGNKEYGLWGFKYFDQHESYWENEVFKMNPVWQDLSADRATANAMRLQNAWNYYFRFMPCLLNHGLAHRMVQWCGVDILDYDRVFDHIGWRYALLSAVSAGGAITLPVVPREIDRIDGYISFYKEWVSFAKNNFNKFKRTVPFGAQVGTGVDGLAKINDNEGYLFLFNPFPFALDCSFEISNRLGFERFGGTVALDMLYPQRENIATLGFGERFEMVVSEYAAVVLSVSKKINRLSPAAKTEALPRTLHFKNGKYFFFAHKKIRDILDEYSDSVSEEAKEAERIYVDRYNRANDSWTRPDRLWLWVCPCEDIPNSFGLKLNGKSVELKTELFSDTGFSVKNNLFADITDLVEWEIENTIELSGDITDAERVTLYLHYPRRENEKLPQASNSVNIRKNVSPIIDKSVNILLAELNSDGIVKQNAENEFRVSVDTPPELLEGVYMSFTSSIGNTGNDMRSDMALKYEDGVWKKRLYSGTRYDLIIDDCKAYFWAVTKDGRESATYKLPIVWELI